MKRVTAIHDGALPRWWVGARVEHETASLYRLVRRSRRGLKLSRRTVRKALVSVEEVS